MFVNKEVFFIQELPLPICVVLTTCSLDFNEHAFFVFQLLSCRQNAAIMGLVCRLLASEGCGRLRIYCPQFCDVNLIHSRTNHLHTWDPAEP